MFGLVRKRSALLLSAASARIGSRTLRPISSSDSGYDRDRLDKVLLQGATFHGRHGSDASENVLGQKFVIDVAAWTTLRPVNDQLEDTVSYADIWHVCENIVQNKCFNLVESVAEQCVRELFRTLPKVTEIQLRVRKPQVPLPGVVEYSGIEITRRRSDYTDAVLFTDLPEKTPVSGINTSSINNISNNISNNIINNVGDNNGIDDDIRRAPWRKRNLGGPVRKNTETRVPRAFESRPIDTMNHRVAGGPVHSQQSLQQQAHQPPGMPDMASDGDDIMGALEWEAEVEKVESEYMSRVMSRLKAE
ncbi:MAG: hypothetical protein MHM6MM_005366 [Cercozoa sp. M6MM]